MWTFLRETHKEGVPPVMTKEALTHLGSQNSDFLIPTLLAHLLVETSVIDVSFATQLT